MVTNTGPELQGASPVAQVTLTLLAPAAPHWLRSTLTWVTAYNRGAVSQGNSERGADQESCLLGLGSWQDLCGVTQKPVYPCLGNSRSLGAKCREML